MFGGNLAIPEATKLNEMARLSQLPNKEKILIDRKYNLAKLIQQWHRNTNKKIKCFGMTFKTIIF